MAERGRRGAGRNAGRKKPNHRGLTTTPTDGGDEMCGRITQNLQLESLIAKYHLRNQPELDLIPHYNGAPGQDIVAVRTQGGARVLEELRWGYTRKSGHSARSWMAVLCGLPLCARIATRHGWVGLVHACPMHARWQDLEEWVQGEEHLNHLTRARALWSRVRHGYVQREIGETGHEHMGEVEGVRCVVTGHTPVPEPVWHENVLGIDTGVHIEDRGYGRLTIARIDAKEIETSSFDRVAEDARLEAG